jgi:hypothetical protein
MTQEMLADMLGVRREGVTEAAGRLQKAGVIHYGRGHIAVLDRPRLEARACECYAVVKEEYARLIPNIGEPKSFLRHASARFTCVAAIAITHLESILAPGQDLPLVC